MRTEDRWVELPGNHNVRSFDLDGARHSDFALDPTDITTLQMVARPVHSDLSGEFACQA